MSTVHIPPAPLRGYDSVQKRATDLKGVSTQAVMEFDEIKRRFESSLTAELGAEHPFRVVTTEEWTGHCPEPPHKLHWEDSPRACFDCYRIHVPESEHNEFTEARIGASVEMIAEQLDVG